MNARIVALSLALIITATSSVRAGVPPVPPGSEVVNVNTASLVELLYLPGVGAAMAARIVSGRPYATVLELGKVKGLGGNGKRLASILPFVTTTGKTTLRGKVHGAPRKPKTSAASARESQRELSLYSAAARESIVRGLRDGSVHFEPSWAGGEYIWSATRHEVRP